MALDKENLDDSLRERLVSALRCAMEPLPVVLAGWEGGSVAFGAVDEYSDIDLVFLVDDAAPLDSLYAAASAAISAVSPITHEHDSPPGRYYKLKDGGEFLLIDLCFLRTEAADHGLNIERHGMVRPLFDKGNWLSERHLDMAELESARVKRLQELKNWFVLSQTFVRKAIWRKKEVEALYTYWGCTLKPLVELLRMRYCPERWDFGLRYLERDLPPTVYQKLRELVFVRDPKELDEHLTKASQWGEVLLSELEVVVESGA